MNVTTDKPTAEIDIQRLWVDSVYVTATPRDWGEDPEQWDYYEAPECGTCGASARWDDNERVWRCATSDCDERGEEIEADAEHGCEGPMMNYSYQLPDAVADPWMVADALRDLPLCLVSFTDSDSWALALTGGGMDLSWEICEAFMRLGYLPPARFAELPSMAGYPGDDNQRAIVRACARTFEWLSGNAAYELNRLREKYPEVFSVD